MAGGVERSGDTIKGWVSGRSCSPSAPPGGVATDQERQAADSRIGHGMCSGGGGEVSTLCFGGGPGRSPEAGRAAKVRDRKVSVTMSAGRLGAVEQLQGYVTTLTSITGRVSSEVEKSLGFAPGSLCGGYRVYVLIDQVARDDFEWKDRTRYSDGWHFDPEIREYVQRRDELRANLGKRLGYDEQAADATLREFMTRQVQRLNVRSGPERIVKVVPAGPIGAFPDSPLPGVPQWRLLFKKRFRVYAEVGPGAIVR